MDFFDILIIIVMLIGPAIGKSLKDKGKIERERSKKIEDVSTKTNHKKYHVQKENFDTRMNVEKQNLFEKETYEFSQKYDEHIENYNYKSNGTTNIGKVIDEEKHNLETKIDTKDISNPILEFTKNDMVKGVIMSEILGKPKSLNRR